MKNKKNELHSGFTIAELLLSMLVVMVVAAAMVPVIGPKKIKVPNINKSHGIFECYYDNGQLMQYYANNRGKKDAHPVKSQHANFCVFNVPQADKYEIYAIGAGSDGYDDPAHVGYTMLSNQFSKSGYIALNNFNASINNASMGDYELQGTMSLSTEIRNLLNEWADYKKRTGSNLYVAFSNIKSPLGKGGAGLADRVISSGNLSNGVNCYSACANNSINCRGPYGKGSHFPTTVNVDAAARANNMCYWYVNEHGSDSAKGRVMSSGMVLFPIDGDMSSEFTIMFNADRSRITTKVRGGGRAELDLKVKRPGNDAYRDSSGVINPLLPGRPATENTPIDTISNTAGALFVSGNSKQNLSSSLLDTYFPFQETHRTKGVQYGIEEGTGLLNQGNAVNAAKSGSANYVNNAFKWTYTTLGVDYEYGGAGEPGDINMMTFNNLSGNLYLFPGTSADGTAADTVVSKSENRENIRGYVLHAASKAQASTYYSERLPLSTDIMPSPHGAIADATVPDNSRFNQYISRINESGFRGGLYRCNEIGFCPGYGGTGAYPFIDVAEGVNTLTIQDMQSLYNNGSRSKDFAILEDAHGTAKCPFGSVKTKGWKSFYDINGRLHSYSDRYCTATKDRRRDGAVIIVW